MKEVFRKEELQHITYRGELMSCNYTCGYCPFARKKESEAHLKKDFDALDRFIQFLKHTEFENQVTVLIAPYGEAMIHEKYQTAMCEISKINHISRISCQTNLSFNEDNFLKTIIKNNADKKKISLWATFHPSMTGAEVFAHKVNTLSKYISLCVGAVGNPEEIEKIKALKKLISPECYFWINEMDGLGRRYTEEEVEEFLKIDPLFFLELSIKKKNYSLCSAGKKSIFLKGDGTVYPCCRSKQKMGNLNEKVMSLEDCNGRCDCFLAYSNRQDIGYLSWFGKDAMCRIPTNHFYRAVFFDLDDTVIYQGQREKTEAALNFLIKCYEKGLFLFAVTALCEEQARKRLGNVFKLLYGGVYAYGAHVQIYPNKLAEFSNFDSVPPCRPIKVFCHEDKPYKMLTKKVTPKLHEYGEVYVEERICVVPNRCSKENGVRRIMEILSLSSEEIITIGNSTQDCGFLKLANNSVAVEGGDDEAIQAACRVLSPEKFDELFSTYSKLI